jgi:hypothetical protein
LRETQERIGLKTGTYKTSDRGKKQIHRTKGVRCRNVRRCADSAGNDESLYAVPRWGRAVLDPYKNKPKEDSRVKRRRIAALERKSPPFAQNAKDGAP